MREKLGRLSGYPDYSLFLCNSGAEANENALKLVSFTNMRSKVIAFKEAFHGRTSGAVACTDNPSIIAPFNANHQVEFIDRFDLKAARVSIEKGNVTAVIIEGIQGVGGIYVPEPDFLDELHAICKQHGTFLILDEIQSGYGRSGKFFAHQYSAVRPDYRITVKCNFIELISYGFNISRMRMPYGNNCMTSVKIKVLIAITI